MFGGSGYTPEAYNDTWSWDGTTWELVSSTGPATPRTDFALVYDPVRAATLLFGGLAFSSVSDSWELVGSTWTAQSPVVLPPARWRHALAYDAIHHAAVVFSGKHAGPTAADTWVRDFESAVRPPERCMRATEDSDGDGLAGCADPDCFARCAPICPPGAPCPTGYPSCGDGSCARVEDYLICPADCAQP